MNMNDYTNRIWTHAEIIKRMEKLNERLSENPFDASANREYRYLDQLRYTADDEDCE